MKHPEWPEGWAALQLVEVEPLREMPALPPVLWHFPIAYALGRSVAREAYWQWAPTDSLALRQWQSERAEADAS